MDFDDTPSEALFREKIRDWLKHNVPQSSELSGKDDVQQARLWQKRKFQAGWACITWPSEYGGRGSSPIEQVILSQEEAHYRLPDGVIFAVGQGMVAPTIMRHASEEIKSSLLPRIASGDDIWCQLFSEPAGGSDLAALRTRAEERDDEWIINGQKIWTSGAHYSDFGLLLARTDFSAPKHKGLTCFLLDMKTPGITVKPIKQMSGASTFNEVFFSDVHVSDANRLGEVGEGWRVAITTLMNERAFVGDGGTEAGFDALLQLAQEIALGDRPAIENDLVKAKLADFYCDEAGLRYTFYRVLTALSHGEMPGPENSIGKLVGASKTQEIASFAIDLLDQFGVIWDERVSPAAALFQSTYMSIPSLRIAGGTDEILANIIGERVLGLPQEPRVDKDIPFNRVPTGAKEG